MREQNVYNFCCRTVLISLSISIAPNHTKFVDLFVYSFIRLTMCLLLSDGFCETAEPKRGNDWSIPPLSLSLSHSHFPLYFAVFFFLCNCCLLSFVFCNFKSIFVDRCMYTKCLPVLEIQHPLLHWLSIDGAVADDDDDDDDKELPIDTFA